MKPVPAAGWSRRHAASLVKVLALAPGHRLHREQVIDAVWPEDTLDQAAPKLHKAAHFARKATGRPEAVVLGSDTVSLFPGAELVVDVTRFEELARQALAGADPGVVHAAIDGYRGELLPQDRYEDWVEQRREHLRLRYVELLRLAGRWGALVEIEPGDEQAHVGLMQQHLTAGDRHAVLRQFERMDIPRDLPRRHARAPGPDVRGGL